MTPFARLQSICLFFVCVTGAGLTAAADAQAEQASSVIVLDAKSLWRCRMVKGTELVRLESGELAHGAANPTGRKKKKKESGGYHYIRTFVKGPERRWRPGPAPEGWIGVDFDDSSWGLFPGPFSGSGDIGSRYHKIDDTTRRLYLRGKFQVPDPGKTGNLTLSLAFEGGVAVYVNGKEIKRAFLPKGKPDFSTHAEDYPLDAYQKDGFVVPGRWSKKFPAMFKKRIRSLDNVTIPASVLRKGVNVLAVRLHCAPAAEILFSGKVFKGRAKYLLWPRVGLEGLALTSASGTGIVPGAPRAPQPKGLRLRNEQIVKPIFVSDQGDPIEKLQPIRIIGVRNGTFSGQIVASSDKPIKGLSAEAGSLKSGLGSVIKASAVKISYALADAPWGGGRRMPEGFDTLGEFPPTNAGKVQPVWVTVRIPADAAAGEYRGTLKVSAKDAEPLSAPISLKVIDWSMPDSSELTTFMGLIQSPHTLAMKYNVGLWSEEHWKLVEKSFTLLGEVSCQILYIPLVSKTHFGNEHSMVRWIPEGEGVYDHDFSIVKRYVKTAVKYMRPGIPVVGLYCWEPSKVASNYAHNTFLGDRKILFSVMDLTTGRLEIKEGPAWGTPECRKFWKPVFKGIKKVLKKHDLEDSMMIALCNDFVPSEGAVSDLERAAPGVPWIVHQHGTGIKPHGRPVGYRTFAWGGGDVSEPDRRNNHSYSGTNRCYGWKFPVIVAAFGRNCLRQSHGPTDYRVYPETGILGHGNLGPWAKDGKRGFSGTDGVGRIGADFWPVLKDKSGRLKGRLVSYYHSWGGLDMNTFGITAILGPGKKGSVPTVRYEMFRECVQENEARIFIEKVLTDKTRCANLGEKLAGRARKILDERTRALRSYDMGHQGARDARWYICSDWQGRSEELYKVAGEVAKALK